MRKINSSSVILLMTLCILSGCAGRRAITFLSQEPGSVVTLVPMDNPESQGKQLTNPVTLNTASMAGKAVRISAQGRAPHYWFAPGDSGRRIEIKVKTLPACNQQIGDKNRPVRLLLKAYQALSTNDPNLARELARKAAEVDPTLAGPYIIIGLAATNQGAKEEARVAFNKARALDPDDADIGELLRLAQ